MRLVTFILFQFRVEFFPYRTSLPIAVRSMLRPNHMRNQRQILGPSWSFVLPERRLWRRGLGTLGRCQIPLRCKTNTNFRTRIHSSHSQSLSSSAACQPNPTQPPTASSAPMATFNPCASPAPVSGWQNHGQSWRLFANVPTTFNRSSAV